MATPNYGYEKRQKELAKKRKKEDKLKEKNERKAHGDTGHVDESLAQDPGASSDSPVPDTP
ncbi:MAG: hypothetical protein WA136_07365 [Rhodoferax sp.]